jgi:hypothetical protein
MNEPIKDPIIGGHGLPWDAHDMVSDLISTLAEKYHFRNGETAAFWAVAYALSGQLGEGKE